MRNKIRISATGLLLVTVSISACQSALAEGAKNRRSSKDTSGRLVKITAQPAKAPEPKEKYRLLPAATDETEGNAAVLYRDAVKSVDDKISPDKVSDWISGPVKKMPGDQVNAALGQAKEALKKAGQAARCKTCDWNALPDEGDFELSMSSLAKYRMLAKLIALEARSEIAKNQYEKAIEDLQTGFSLARDINHETDLIQGLVGVAVASLMVQQLEELIQIPETPNLYWALSDLPSPLIDLSKQMEQEISRLESDQRFKGDNMAPARAALESNLKASHARVQLLSDNLDRQIAAMRCIEAIRLYAAMHEGKLPANLKEITEVAVPDDPVTKKPFMYKVVGRKAVLDAPAPETSPPSVGFRYELRIAK